MVDTNATESFHPSVFLLSFFRTKIMMVCNQKRRVLPPRSHPAMILWNTVSVPFVLGTNSELWYNDPTQFQAPLPPTPSRKKLHVTDERIVACAPSAFSIRAPARSEPFPIPREPQMATWRLRWTNRSPLRGDPAMVIKVIANK